MQVVLFLACLATCCAQSADIVFATANLGTHSAGPFSLLVVLTDGDETDPLAGSATIKAYAFDGGVAISQRLRFGQVVGTAPQPVSLGLGSSVSGFSLEFTPGSTLSFKIDVVMKEDSQRVPPRLTFYILDGSGLPLPTLSPAGDYFLGMDLIGPRFLIESYSSDATRWPYRGGAVSIPAPGVQYTSNSAPSVTSVSPEASSGFSTTRQFVISDVDGVSQLGIVNVLINSALDGRSACYIAFDPVGNVLHLVKDIGSGLISMSLPSAATLSNGQCSIPGAGVTFNRQGNSIILQITFLFEPEFTGNKIVWAAARDSVGGNSGWQLVGTHILGQVAAGDISPLTVTPLSGTGSAMTVTVSYQDPTDARNLAAAQILINTAVDGRSACYLGFDNTAKVLYLIDDYSGSLLPQGLSAGTVSAVAENSQCVVNAINFSHSVSGKVLTLRVSVQFKATFAGRRAVFAGVQNRTGLNSGWRALGTWAVQ